ncbi:hypothetical protein BC829DRAFT_28153 [Chytridium lagenaria]|nr:hypothetical protein BC829DRAFT_28153 [Chytridium lagenaria]
MGSSTKGLQALLPVLVPDIVVKACRPELASDEDLSPMRKTLRVPGLLSCVGVVAILDLSGYTALSELLFKGSDNAGGERLFKTVNPFFGAMIDTIRQYGGDIIKFCGDSIIIAWSQPSTEDVMDVTHAFIQNALLCVADMLQKYDGFKVELPDGEARGSDASLYNSAKVERKQDYKMGLHIGMGLGSFTHVFVGEKRKGRAEYLIIGKAIAEAACMLQKTKRGQIALTRRGWDAFLKRKSYTDEDVLGSENKPIIITRDSETMRLLQPLLSSVNGNATAATVSSPNIIIYRKVEEFMDDSTVLRLSSLAVDSVALDSLHTRLSELRRVTTVFLQIPDLSPQMEPSGALNLIQKLFEIVRVPLENYKGRLRQIVFDDKGLTFLLVWGLPPSNAMDHTLALFCALAIKDALLATSLAEFSIGVSSGPTFIGVIGNEIRSDFNLFGRSLNIAARCMALPMARKSVLCDLASIESKIIDAGGFEFSNPIEMKIKGVDNIKELALLRSGTKDPLRAELDGFRNQTPNHTWMVKMKHAKWRWLEDKRNGCGGERIHAWISQSSVPNPVTPEANQEPVPQVRPSGVMIFGKSGCGKTSMGKLCENLIISKTDAKRTIFCQMDCFEIARHAPFYVLKLLLSQVFDFLLLSKDILKESKQKVELFLKDDLQHRAFAKKGKVWRSASVHSVKTGISKLDSAMRLPPFRLLDLKIFQVPQGPTAPKAVYMRQRLRLLLS